MMTTIAFTNLLNIEGVDGYAVFDSNFVVLETAAAFKVPEGYQALFADAFSISLSGDSADISSAIVLAERGAWMLAQLKGITEPGQPAYLAVMAGTREAVDIPQLEAAVASIV